MNRRSTFALGTVIASSLFIASGEKALSYDFKVKKMWTMGSSSGSKINQEQEQTKAMLNDRKLDLRDKVTAIRSRGKITQEEAERLYNELNKIGEINIKDNSSFSPGQVKGIAKRLNYVNQQIESHNASNYQEAPQGRTSYARSWGDNSNLSDLTNLAEKIRDDIERNQNQDKIRPGQAGKLKKTLNQITVQIAKAPRAGGLDSSNIRVKLQNQLHELERQVKIASLPEDKPLE